MHHRSHMTLYSTPENCHHTLLCSGPRLVSHTCTLQRKIRQVTVWRCSPIEPHQFESEAGLREPIMCILVASLWGVRNLRAGSSGAPPNINVSRQSTVCRARDREAAVPSPAKPDWTFLANVLFCTCTGSPVVGITTEKVQHKQLSWTQDRLLYPICSLCNANRCYTQKNTHAACAA